jgi:hypothetical protein
MPPTTTVLSINVLPGADVTAEQYSIALDSVSDGLTATPSGTIATSVLLISRVSRFTTVASTGACRLPPAEAGALIKVYASGSNNLSVFPASAALGGIAGGDAINAGGAGNAYTLTSGNMATFTCVTTGQWYAQQAALS